MKTVHIICSIKNLNTDYADLQWLRMFFLSNGYRLSEDWINHSLVLQNSKPHFQPAPNFDYMTVATQAIQDADLIVFLMSEHSNFTQTMLRYALHLKRPSFLICNKLSVIEGLEEADKTSLTVFNLRTYKDKLREVL